MPMMTSWVRRYALRDLLDESFELFRTLAPALCLAGVLPYGLLVLYTVLMRHYVIPGNLLAEYLREALEALRNSDQPGLQRVLSNGPCITFLLGFYGALGLALLLSFLVQCRLAISYALGQPLSLGKAFLRLAKPFWSLLLLAVLYLIVAGNLAGLVLIVCMIPLAIILPASGTMFTPAIGVVLVLVIALMVLLAEASALWLAVFLLAAPVAMVQDRLGPFAALSQGFRTARANFKAHALAFYAFTRLPVIIFPLLLLAGWLLSEGLRYLPQTLTLLTVPPLVLICSITVFTALLACLQVLIYLDGRCRHEALDLQLLAREIGLGSEVEQAFRTPTLPARFANTTAPNYAASPPPLEEPVTAEIPREDEVQDAQ